MGKPNTLSHRVDHGGGGGENDNITLLTPGFFAAHALSGLELHSEELDILQDIQRSNQDGNQEDHVAKAAKEL